ncbi:MAG: hypothetical protein FJX72_11450 [Armatimonadetes bacterium]|nr:hypothetical protein [Armatimonadota bacterium]
MDEVTLAVLWAELREDAEVMRDAAATARARLGSGSVSEAEAAAFHLARAYNAAEMAAQRVARAFENSINGSSGWHAGLLRRMSLEVPGVRPALYNSDVLARLSELRGFRHAFRHAYDMVVDPARIAALIGIAEGLVEPITASIRRFVIEVADRNGLQRPPDMASGSDLDTAEALGSGPPDQ